MHYLGIVISFCVFFLGALLLLRGAVGKLIRLYPLFYSYIIYNLLSFVGIYLIYWLRPQVYASAYWINYLVSILVEFTVLVEISDQIFRPFPAIRNLGRALTVLISLGLGIFYILPTILGSSSRSRALLGFALRASVTKAIILAVLFYVAHYYASPLGKNVRGLMLGFSIYVAMNIAIMATARAFGSALFAQVLWAMLPLASMLCVLVWTLSLWELAPMPLRTISTDGRTDSETVALELNRFNSELSRLLHK